MIPFLDCSPGKAPEIAGKLNAARYGQLLTPLTNYRVPDTGLFGVDNGGYTEQNAGAWVRLLKKVLPSVARCRFIALPDVPGSAIRTLELFYIFQPQMSVDWPICLVIQDGQESLPIPWEKIHAVFIAGSGEWKMGAGAKHIIQAAKWLGKWVHVGRISDPERWEYFSKLGCNSADSSAFVRPFPGRMDKMAEYFKEKFK